MDYPSRRAAYPGRRLRRPQRRVGSPRTLRRLIACTALVATTAAGEPTLSVVPHAGLRSAYVDNPFFDPLDPTSATQFGIPSTQGDSAQFDLSGGLRTVWRAIPSGRAELSLFGRFSAWQGTADTTGWDVGLQIGWLQEVADDLEARIDVLGAAAAIDVFPADDLSWGEIRLGGHWRIAGHMLDGRIGYGQRAQPDRIVDVETGETGQRDHLVRARLGARFGLGADLVIEPAFAIDLTLPAIDGGVEHDTHALSVHVSRPLLGLDADATLSGWLRDFPDWLVDDSTRLDEGLAIELRLARRLARGLELAGRYRYLRSTSNEPLGRYAQQFAGLELFAWYSPERGPVAATVADATPLSTSAGWIFRHRAVRAASVALVGDFNDWSSTQDPLAGPDADGWWTVIVALAPGRQSYMFVVDGERFVRPADAPAYIDDGFGGEVGVLYVLPAGAARANR